MFDLIDLDSWGRREYYCHFMNEVVCTYSLTANLDITALKGAKLYPAMLWLLTQTVNEMSEFRTALSDDGVGIFETMNPSYTIFNEQTKTFSVIWSEYNDDFETFLNNYSEDVEKYKTSTAFAPKANKPPNTFDVSMIPWTTFSAFNINVFGAGNYLLPIFTMGKIFTDGTKNMLPIAMQVHHAVCDGYHVSLFLEKLQEKIDGFTLDM